MKVNCFFVFFLGFPLSWVAMKLIKYETYKMNGYETYKIVWCDCLAGGNVRGPEKVCSHGQ